MIGKRIVHSCIIKGKALIVPVFLLQHLLRRQTTLFHKGIAALLRKAVHTCRNGVKT